METLKVKELREKYGIMDSRNIYTEEQILRLIKQKLYYIKINKEDKEFIAIEYKQVLGYISEDDSACIFIKNGTITGNDKVYMPYKKIKSCVEVEEGVYYSYPDGVIYCFNDDLHFWTNYLNKRAEIERQQEIKELEEYILKLKNTEIIFKEI